MRKLVAACIVFWLALFGPAHAQLTATGVGGGFGGGSAALPLDGVSNIKVAFSTRKLLTAYGGSALRVIEHTGSTTQDIGFVANVLDTSSLTTFCSGKTCSISIWYDQSGNGNNVIPFVGQPLEGPVIYTGGALKTLNTKPALFFDPAASPFNRLQGTFTTNPVNRLYVNSVVRLTNSSGQPNPIAGTQSFNDSFTFVADGSPYKIDTRQFSSFTIAGQSSGSITSGTAGVFETDYDASSGAWSFWIDGSASGTGTNLLTFSASTFQFGNNVNGGFGQVTDATMGEFIEIDQVGAFSGRAALQTNQKAYWGTP
jgi:Alpha-L-arabinofuranosidase B, catalytic